VEVDERGVFVFKDVDDDVQGVELVDDSAERGGNGECGDGCDGKGEDGLGQLHFE
jgi:hypothetical protein